MEPSIRQRRAEKDKEPTVNILLQKQENPARQTISRLLYVVAVILIFLWVFQTNFGFVGSHSHGHAHDHDEHDHGYEESPAFKYSKQANEKVVPQQHSTGHSHNHDDHEHHHHEDHHDKAGKAIPVPELRNPNLWLEAILSTLFISAAPFFILFLIPLDNSKENQNLLKILLSFASGGLLGDAFLHLIPHAILAKGGDDDGHGHSHSHSHSHSHDEKKVSGSDSAEFHAHDLSVGLWVLVGIITFLMVEKLIRIMKGGHGHSHSHAPPQKIEAKKEDTDKNGDTKGGKGKKGKENKDSGKGSKNSNQVQSKQGTSNPPDEIKVAGYLNLAADFTHNFTDGLAIGASFLAGRSVGIVTTFTILIHEVPHEIGDFAILIQSGCSKKKAILLQLLTAVGALSGTLVSLLAEGVGDAAIAWILPFTAGGFIYIATVSVIPELLHETTFRQSLKEIVALLAGVYMMVLIAQYE